MTCQCYCHPHTFWGPDGSAEQVVSHPDCKCDCCQSKYQPRHNHSVDVLCGESCPARHHAAPKPYSKVNAESMVTCPDCKRLLPRADCRFMVFGVSGCCEQCYEQAVAGKSKRYPFGVKAAKAAAVQEMEAHDKAQYDFVNAPAHYAFGKFEVIDVIEDWGLGFHLGNAVKYIARAGRKDPAKTIEDLRKAEWYVQRQIKMLEGQ